MSTDFTTNAAAASSDAATNADATTNTAASGAATVGSIAVLTHHNDNGRTGANLNETILTTSNVNPQKFGKRFQRTVDGHIYAQILYVSNVPIPNKGVHNVVYVATMHNTVYAFDADGRVPDPLWLKNLGPSVRLPDTNIGPAHVDQRTKQTVSDYRDIAVEVGILSTPVISLTHNAIYVVAMTKDPKRQGLDAYTYHLHALDLSTGQEKLGGPVQLQATVRGKGDASTNGQITFASHRHNQRPALLLANDKIYIAFAAFGDAGPYHGWVFAYDAATLKQAAVFNTTPNSGEGGIWQAGSGLAADSANQIYLITGNGGYIDGTDFGDCFIKLRPNLTVLDWFSPFNNSALSGHDADVGSAGPLLIPGTNLLVGGGKEGKFHLIQRDKMGHLNKADNSQIVQDFYVTLPNNPNDAIGSAMADGQSHHIHGSPVHWNGPHGPCVYVWPENTVLHVFAMANGKFQTKPSPMPIKLTPQDQPIKTQQGVPMAQSSESGLSNIPGTSRGMPGGMLSISASGNTPGTGIVWVAHPLKDNANQAVVEGIVRAYDASSLKELWNSKANPQHDTIGNFAKFCPPTIANGKVYVASFSGFLAVYGLQ